MGDYEVNISQVVAYLIFTLFSILASFISCLYYHNWSGFNVQDRKKFMETLYCVIPQ
jgi:hypothetical protein